MKRALPIFGLAILLALAGLSALPHQTVSAASGANWQAGRIIDDSLFMNNSSMSVAQIQDFLNQKVGTGGYDSIPGQCDITGARNAQPYSSATRAQYAASLGRSSSFTCLSNYYEVPKTTPGLGIPASNYGGAPIPAGAESAAQLIWDAAQRYNISPKVLLVTIQKESAGPLTTDDWPFQKQYTYAMGAHCPDSGPNGTANCDANYAGFSIQISESAALFRYYLDNMSQPWWTYKKPGNNDILYQNSMPACGSSVVNITTKATAALYTYTPYQPDQAALDNLYGLGDACSAYGNRNFWRIYTDWFGTTTGTNIVRTATDQTFYLISNDHRFAIPNADILYAYGLEKTVPTVVSDSYLASIIDGGMLGTIFTVPGNQTVYLADGNTRYGIPSAAYCTAWNLACNTSVQKELGPEIINTMFSGGTLKLLMANQGSVYLMDSGQKRLFASPKALTENGYSFGDVDTIVNFTNAIRPNGKTFFESNSFVKFGASPAIFIYNSGKFYGFADYSSFKNWNNPNIPMFYDANSAWNQALPLPDLMLTSLVDFGDGNTYLLDDGAKIDTGALKSSFPAPLNVSFLAGLQAQFVTATTLLTNSTLRLSSGGIYSIQLQKKLPFNSLADYFLLGNSAISNYQLRNNNLSDIPTGKLLIAEGRLLKLPSDQQTIYATGPNSTLYTLTNTNQLGQFNFDTSNVPQVDAMTASSYSVNGQLRSLVKIDSNYYVITRGGKVIVPSSLYATYNLTALPRSDFTSQALKNLATTATLDKYLQTDSGLIFYIENGLKRPISSYQKFKDLGGTTANTIQAPNDFISSIPDGAVI